MRDLLAGALSGLATIIVSRLLVAAYARHARRGLLASLVVLAALGAAATAMLGARAMATALPGPEQRANLPLLLSGAALFGLAAWLARALARSLARVRPPVGRLTVKPGDLLPDLPALDENGAPVALASLLGPRGALFVWYRGLT